MKELNKNGFTLIELLAVIVILGVVMAIAVPSMMGYIEDSKKDALVSSAEQYIDGANTMLLSANELPTPGTGVVVLAEDIELQSGGTSPYTNAAFVPTLSYVAVTNVNGTYTYYAALQDGSQNCLELTEKTVLGGKVKDVRTHIKSGTTACAIPSVSASTTDFSSLKAITKAVTYSVFTK